MHLVAIHGVPKVVEWPITNKTDSLGEISLGEFADHSGYVDVLELMVRANVIDLAVLAAVEQYDQSFCKIFNS